MNASILSCFEGRRLRTVSLRALWVLSFILWVAGVVYGFSRMISYEAAFGKVSSEVPKVWPQGSQVPSPFKIPALIMFAHPECPCTRASISELEKVMSSLYGRVEASVYFAKPSGFSDEKVRASLWRKAEKIPGVRVFLDQNNEETNRFHSKTSGETFLYGQDGKLLFHGGVTLARGHEGANAGSDWVKDIILKGNSKEGQTQVFGCPLEDRENKESGEYEN